MKTEIKKLAQSNIEIVGELSWEEFEVFFQKALKQISGQVKMGGFRPGKAPQGLVEEKIGDSHLLEEAAELAIQDKYQQIIHQEKIEPISKPEVSVLKLAKNNSFQFKIKAATLPEVKLPDYKKIAIAVEKKVSQVDDSEIEETIKWIARSRAELSELNRPCQKGDWLEMEYQSPQVEMNKKFEDAFLLGEGKFVPGFEDELYGLTANSEKEFKISFPAGYQNKELAGKEVDFKVKIKTVKEMKLPEMNDEFAQKVGKFNNIAELKENIKNGIAREKNVQQTQKWREQVLDRISQETKLDIPDSLITAETEPAEQAKQKITHYLILREIAKQEGITASEEEITQLIDKFLTSYPQGSPQEIDRDKLREYYKEMITNEKVFQFLENI